jgi:hypothetical protein
VFDALRIHGGGGALGPGTLVWGYRPVAVLTSWRITKAVGGWQLTATLASLDRWQVQQAVARKELLFTAPRDRGQWCWELNEVDLGTSELRAILGNPLQ